MKQMESLVRAAIGIDDKRGDQLSVENVAFTMPATDVPAPATKMQRVMQFAERWTGVLRYVALSLLFVLVYVLLLRPVKNQVIQILKNPSSGGLMPVASGPDGAELPAGAAVPLMESGNPADAAAASNARVMTTLKNQLVTKVKADPETASRLIQNWLKQSEAHK
jgi:flagellar M-ring protein FliF